MKKFYYFFALLMCVLGVQNVSAKKAVTVTADSDLSTLAYTMEALEGVEVTKADGTVTLYTNPESFGLGHPLMVDETDAVVVKIKDGFKVVKCIINDELQDVPFPGSFTIPTENIHVWVACAPMKSYEIPYVIDGKGGTCIDPVVFMSKGDHNAPLTELSHSGTRGAVYPTEFADVLIIKPNAETNGYIKKVVFTTEDGEVEGVADGDGEYSIALEGLVSVYIEANEVDRNVDVIINFDKNPRDLTHMVDVTGAKNDLLLDFNAYNDPQSNVQLPGVGDNIVKVDAGYDLPLTLNINNKYNSASKVYAVNADGTKEEIEPAYTGGHVFVITTLDGIAQFNVEIGEPVRDTEFTLTANKKFADAVHYLYVEGATHMYVAAQIDTNERPATLYNSNADADKTSEDGKTATFKASMSWDMPMTVHYQLKDADNRSIDRLFVVAEDGTKTEITNRDANGFVVSAEDLAGATDLYLQFGVRDTEITIAVDKDLDKAARVFTTTSRVNGDLVNFIDFSNGDNGPANAGTQPYPTPMQTSIFKIDVNEDYPLNITCTNIFGTNSELFIVDAEGNETAVDKAGHSWAVKNPLAEGECLLVKVGEPERTVPLRVWVDKDVPENCQFFSIASDDATARKYGLKSTAFFTYYPGNDANNNVPTPQVANTIYVNPDYDFPLVVNYMSTIDNNATAKVVVGTDPAKKPGTDCLIHKFDTEKNVIKCYLGYKADHMAYMTIDKDLQKVLQYVTVTGAYNPALGATHGLNVFEAYGPATVAALPTAPDYINFYIDPTCDLPLTVSLFAPETAKEKYVPGVKVVNKATGAETECFSETGSMFDIYSYDGNFQTINLYLAETKPVNNRDQNVFVTINEEPSDFAYTFALETIAEKREDNLCFMDMNAGDDSNAIIPHQNIGEEPYIIYVNEVLDAVVTFTTQLKSESYSVFVTVNGETAKIEQIQPAPAAKFLIKGLKKDDRLNIRYYDVAVGIDSVNANKLNGKIYTINGVEVKEATQPGLYIVNGKKVVVK